MNVENIVIAAEMMLQGMVGIFVVLGLIALIVWGMGKMGSKKK